jgi:hypothetical protein
MALYMRSISSLFNSSSSVQNAQNMPEFQCHLYVFSLLSSHQDTRHHASRRDLVAYCVFIHAHHHHRRAPGLLKTHVLIRCPKPGGQTPSHQYYCLGAARFVEIIGWVHAR